MVRGLLIFATIGFLLYKFGKYIFRFLYLFAGKESDPYLNSSRSNKVPKDGNINIDKVPSKQSGNKDFKGGEYVDYEEL